MCGRTFQLTGFVTNRLAVCGCARVCAVSSLLKLIKEDYRRRQLTAAEVRLEDILGDIEANPVKFTVASSLTDDRQWLHFVAQQGAPRPLRRLVECGADIHARDAVRPPSPPPPVLSPHRPVLFVRML